MRVLVTGATSRPAALFIDLVRTRVPGATITTLGRQSTADLQLDLNDLEALERLAPQLAAFDRVFVGHGWLQPKQILQQTPCEMIESFTVNVLSTVRLIERALTDNTSVRIVVLGSESGINGSFDGSYALAKSALHQYVRTRALHAVDQQLVCIAPSMIEDAGMTERRADQDRVRARARRHPKQRLLCSSEVAELAYFLLFTDQGYITNQVISIDGGVRT